jgi:hypothetical protein
MLDAKAVQVVDGYAEDEISDNDQLTSPAKMQQVVHI